MTSLRATYDAGLHLLDRQIVDPDDAPVANVDDLELRELPDGRLAVSALLIGPGALGPRTGGRLGAWMVAIWRRLRPDADPRPGRIEARLVTHTDSAVHVRLNSPPNINYFPNGNETWIDTLGMTRDNAMLIRTGDRAPGVVRDALEKVVGEDTSIQLVDLATRRGIDPSAVQVAVVTGTVADAVGVYKYSVLGGGRIAPDPAWVSSHITTEVVPILGAVTCNKLIFPQLRAALQEVQALGLADKIHPSQYAGCYYPRFIAGTTTLSNHAYGLALDINAVENGRGTAGEIDRGVVAVFKRWGFAWGGDWHYTDPMHFEMSQAVSPSSASARSAAP